MLTKDQLLDADLFNLASEIFRDENASSQQRFDAAITMFMSMRKCESRDKLEASIRNAIRRMSDESKRDEWRGQFDKLCDAMKQCDLVNSALKELSSSDDGDDEDRQLLEEIEDEMVSELRQLFSLHVVA